MSYEDIYREASGCPAPFDTENFDLSHLESFWGTAAGVKLKDKDGVVRVEIGELTEARDSVEALVQELQEIAPEEVEVNMFEVEKARAKAGFGTW